MTDPQTLVTGADLDRWQARAYIRLGELIAAGRRIELPPLLWTLTTSGAITGEADPVSYSAGEQREAVRRWARLLDVEVDERTDQDGTVHLYAPWKGGTDNLVRGCIRATVRPALDDEDGE
ncbi:hypothetical protein [Streptomyces erythrochromogenes]|uniref:hypothetical protein n=1 Tax=Streptomyces erythrochromogenes TaxID=285574 RepID=UPI003868EA27|nr:hypothetical protein OG364_29500 [Streptomyces erythrochromogenes]